MDDGPRDRRGIAPPRLDEKSLRRQNLADWDRRWHRLSVEARYFVLHQLTAPLGSPDTGSTAPDVSIGMLPRSTVEELSAAGFIEIEPRAARGLRDRIVASAGLHDFALRAHILRRFHLLDIERPSEFAGYVSHAYSTSRLTELVSGVLRAAGIDGGSQLDDVLTRYVIDERWPASVAKSLNEPLADRILGEVLKAKEPIPLAELPVRIEGSNPYDIRLVVDKLVVRLALVEDIRPWKWEIVVGILPAVREKMAIASMPRDARPCWNAKTPGSAAPKAARSSTTFGPCSSKSRVSLHACGRITRCFTKRSNDSRPLSICWPGGCSTP